jgi:hypothetical protein
MLGPLGGRNGAPSCARRLLVRGSATSRPSTVRMRLPRDAHAPSEPLWWRCLYAIRRQHRRNALPLESTCRMRYLSARNLESQACGKKLTPASDASASGTVALKRVCPTDPHRRIRMTEKSTPDPRLQHCLQTAQSTNCRVCRRPRHAGRYLVHFGAARDPVQLRRSRRGVRRSWVGHVRQAPNGPLRSCLRDTSKRERKWRVR